MSTIRVKSKYYKRYKGDNKKGNAKKEFLGYYAEFYDPDRRPKQKRFSLKTKDEFMARQRLSDLERQHAFGEFDPWADTVSGTGLVMAEATKKFIKSRENLRLKTIQSYEGILKLFGKSLPIGILVSHIDEKHVQQFLQQQSLNETSKQTYLRHLNVFFNWAVKEQLVKSNPVAAVQAGLGSARKRKDKAPFLTEDEFEKLIHLIEVDYNLSGDAAAQSSNANQVANPTWLTDALRFAVNTGLRRGELCSLQWSAVTLSKGMVKVQNTEEFKTKSGEERVIYPAGKGWRVIQRLAQARTSSMASEYVFKGARGGQLNGEYLSKRFREYRRKAGFSDEIDFHSLRHTFASWAVMRGMDIYRLKEILGHSDIAVTMKYAHLQPDATRQDMQRFFGDDQDESLAEANTRLLEENAELQAEIERLKQQQETGKPHAGV
ncbi:MAG: site-specific integrase [Rhodothermales bacterium]